MLSTYKTMSDEELKEATKYSYFKFKKFIYSAVELSLIKDGEKLRNLKDIDFEDFLENLSAYFEPDTEEINSNSFDNRDSINSIMLIINKDRFQESLIDFYSQDQNLIGTRMINEVIKTKNHYFNNFIISAIKSDSYIVDFKKMFQYLFETNSISLELISEILVKMQTYDDGDNMHHKAYYGLDNYIREYTGMNNQKEYVLYLTISELAIIIIDYLVKKLENKDSDYEYVMRLLQNYISLLNYPRDYSLTNKTYSCVSGIVEAFMEDGSEKSISCMINFFVGNLDTTQYFVQKYIDKIEKFKYSSVLRLFSLYLNSRYDYSMRKIAHKYINEHDSKEAVDIVIIEIATSTNDLKDRADAIRILKGKCSKYRKADRVAFEYLQSDKDKIRSAAVTALTGSLSSKRFTRIYRQEKSIKVKSAIVEALCEYDEEYTKKFLLKILRDQDELYDKSRAMIEEKYFDDISMSK